MPRKSAQNFLKVSAEELKFCRRNFASVRVEELPGLISSKENPPRGGGVKIWGLKGVSEFFYGFDMCQCHSNKSNSTFGVIGDVVANLCSTLPK